MLVLPLVLLVGCSADSPCSLGGLGWCENGMAALAAHVAAAQNPQTIAIVEEGFTVNPARYGVAVIAVKPDALSAYVSARAASPDSIMAVINSVRVTNTAGYGRESAQGTATISVYQGATLLRTETVRGRLLGTTWTLVADPR